MIKPADPPAGSAPAVGPELPSLVLFGRSATGRPRAAWFSSGDADAATVAAGVSKLQTQPLGDGAQREIGGQFARGRILASGKAFVPFAPRDLYGRFTALVGDTFGFKDTAVAQTDKPKLDGKPAAGKPAGNGAASGTTSGAAAPGVVPVEGGEGGEKPHPTPEPAKPRPGDPTFIGEPVPRSPAQIGLGSVVLAHAGSEDGWWEAEVIAFNGRVFSLRWRDYPTEPTILRRGSQVALLPAEIT